MKSIFIALLFFCYGSIFGQSFRTTEVIEAGKAAITSEVGAHLVEYLLLDSTSYYSINSAAGKPKLVGLTDHDFILKETFEGMYVRFWLLHPALAEVDSDIRLWVKLDPNLKPEKVEFLNRIPSFLVANEASNWLNTAAVDSISANLDFKEEVKAVTKTISYDIDDRRYYWIVTNTTLSEKCKSQGESIYLNVVTGAISKRRDFYTIKTHCN